ncbi:unnamed protein product [Pleuronectes platessa]|uniref:Uncharacterized protein n=1 Tax=Pleuronectes platessa TaxID=8262 RepID=A0A9N7YJ73_PLEPL|nr:unnamed protein product [Pleuronectes platessa]
MLSGTFIFGQWLLDIRDGNVGERLNIWGLWRNIFLNSFNRINSFLIGQLQIQQSGDLQRHTKKRKGCSMTSRPRASVNGCHAALVSG